MLTAQTCLFLENNWKRSGFEARNFIFYKRKLGVCPRAYKNPIKFNLFKYMEGDQNYLNGDSNDMLYAQGDYTNENDENETGEQREKRKRRSKNDPEGRQHKCDFCGKTYLSRPALSQHIKTKHQDKIGEYKRGRGRPRKNDSEVPGSYQKDKYIDFFIGNELRKKDEDYEWREVMKNSVIDLYSKNVPTLNPEKKDIEKEHALLQTTINNENEINGVFYDECILRYFDEVSKQTNKTYFDFVVKFCVLFRESFNRLKKKEDPNLEKDYSSFNSAEEVPDKCNDFITEFMEINDYFALDSGEVIEIIQHFCHWLYEKSYTTSVLSLA